MAVCYRCDQVMFIGLTAEKSKQIENDIAVDPKSIFNANFANETNFTKNY